MLGSGGEGKTGLPGRNQGLQKETHQLTIHSLGGKNGDLRISLSLSPPTPTSIGQTQWGPEGKGTSPPIDQSGEGWRVSGGQIKPIEYRFCHKPKLGHEPGPLDPRSQVFLVPSAGWPISSTSLLTYLCFPVAAICLPCPPRDIRSAEVPGLLLGLPFHPPSASAPGLLRAMLCSLSLHTK